MVNIDQEVELECVRRCQLSNGTKNNSQIKGTNCFKLCAAQHLRDIAFKWRDLYK